MCACLTHAPYWEPGLQLRYVPKLGIKPGPFGSQAGAQSIESHQPELRFLKDKSISDSMFFFLVHQVYFVFCFPLTLYSFCFS